MKQAFIIINEQHMLLKNQVEVLQKAGFEFFTCLVPATGWNLKKIREQARVFELAKKSATKNKRRLEIIFASPVPALMSILSQRGIRFKVFHNDFREKKESPNGKIIMAIAQVGWMLV